MIEYAECIGKIAPVYNLILVSVVVLLFIKLFTLKNKKIYFLPWKLLFTAVIIYIMEEILTVLNYAGIFEVPRITNAFFEFCIIVLFIYTLLKQKEYLKNQKIITKRK